MYSEEIPGTATRKICLACNREFTGIVASCPHDGTMLIPVAQDQLVGTKLADRYQILSVIGHGGMGVVYKARHDLMDRIVAIKMLQSQLISDSMSVKRFQQEAKAASKLKHPNVITLYDFGISEQGQPYLVMDYLEGISLADVIKKDGKVGVDRSINVFAQTCRALDHAHHQGVIHRDLKPGNIMLVNNEGEPDFVKVVDFGVAKLISATGEESQRLTMTGEVCGSPVYMSPEQCMGQKLDSRSDIYTLGVVLYEALTGRLPLLGSTMVDTMSKHISEMPPRLAEVRPDLYIPERLENVVFKALQKNRELRHQSMAEFEFELVNAVPRPGNRVLRVTVPVDPEHEASRRHRMRWLAGAGAVVALLVLAVLAFTGFLKRSPVDQAAVEKSAPVPSPAAMPKANSLPVRASSGKDRAGSGPDGGDGAAPARGKGAGAGVPAKAQTDRSKAHVETEKEGAAEASNGQQLRRAFPPASTNKSGHGPQRALPVSPRSARAGRKAAAKAPPEPPATGNASDPFERLRQSRSEQYRQQLDQR